MKKHILLVDDNVASLKYAENILGEHYNVTCLTSGTHALRFLSKYTPDLILLDINMPEMDGFDIMKTLRSNQSLCSIPVIFLTSQSDPQTEESALSLGVLDFIAKPMVAQTALSRIRMHLELIDYRKNLEDIVKQKTDMVDRLQSLLSDSVSELVEHRDGNTGSHIKRLRSYVDVLIDKLQEKNLDGYLVDEKFRTDIIRATPLHDIGKIRVRDDVLLKPAKLDMDEMDHMKLHTVWGSEVIEHVISQIYFDSFLEVAKNVIRYHHEKWNGTGYPEGLRGQQIPLCARIMSIADVYDALVTERPYKKPFSHYEAMSIIVEGRGVAFDPVLVDIFIEVSDRFNEIAKNFDA